MLAASDFTTHGVIVGMTGSGKTGLGVVLLEEALLSGVPALIIDPKGDLTNLALTFPELRPSDFRPWINDGDAQRAGSTPDAFAEQEATKWRDGLASWGVAPERIARPPQHCRDDDLHTRLHVRGAAQPRGFVASTEGCRCRDDRRRGRGIRVRSPRTRRHRRRPAVESRAHPAVEHRRGFVERGTRPRPRHPRRAGAVAADPQARVSSISTRSSRHPIALLSRCG